MLSIAPVYITSRLKSVIHLSYSRAPLIAAMSSFGGRGGQQGRHAPYRRPQSGHNHSNPTHDDERPAGSGEGRGRTSRGRRGGRNESQGRYSNAPAAGHSAQHQGPKAHDRAPNQQHRQPVASSYAHQPLLHRRELHQHTTTLQHHERHHQHQQEQPEEVARPPASAKALSGVMFQSLGLHRLTLAGLHDVFGYQEMFLVQAAACPPALQGNDVLAKAKTGTGKTLAFLVPIAEHLAAAPPLPVGGAIRSLIMAPTRELAAQIKAEAVKLLQPHGDNVGVQMVIGGTNINRERSGLNSSHCDVLIATPGRLQDHIDSTPGFAGRLWGVQVLVLDEVDRLLDMGFRPAIEAIMKHLPPARQRQTLMFSATLPKGVTEVASSLMRGDYVAVDTVGDDERPSHESITQEYMLVPAQLLMAQLMAVIKAHMQAEPEGFKVIVFFPTARAAQFHAALARAAGCNCLDLHSRLSQKQRDTAAAAFGSSRTSVLFASDVIARGLDFPDVSLVVQVGLTDATQYEHRVGRTGRAGKTGEALLLLAEDEARLLPLLAGMPLKPAGPDSRTSSGRVLAAAGGRVQGPSAWEGLDGALGQVTRDDALLRNAEQAFVATLGFLAGKLKQLGWSKEQLVSNVKLRFSGLGLNYVPAIEARTLGKMNLRGVAGIEVAPPQQRGQGGARGGRGRGGR